MRERTTWNREMIAGRTSGRTAEDPRAMNQDHHSQQPADDDYLIGGPSEFAEDVHPSAGTWKAEQEGGETARDEIGLPDFRDDTFKTAADDEGEDEEAGEDEETLTKKADVCIKVARTLLGNVDESEIEDQALALMHLPDVELVETATRLAKGKVPPEFLEHQKGKKEDGEDEDKEDKEDKEEKGQQKDASAWSNDVVQAMQSGDQEAVQAAIQGMVNSMMQPQQQQAQQQEQQQAQQQEQQQAQQQQEQQAAMYTAEQVQQMVQQAMQQQGQQQQQGCMGCGDMMSEDQMIDDMLQDAPMEEDMDVQLEGVPMDIGEVDMGQGDEVLSTLFASNPEVQQAKQAQAIQTGIPQSAQGVRTASTRTVGTQPTGGVSQIGGAASPGNGGSGDIDKLSNLWRSAPDVKAVFND